jgi:GNAT superfamily N-acetyltransferase
MTILAVEIRRLDPQTATDAEWRALNALNNILEAEFFPEDPPQKLETTMSHVRDIPAYVDARRWHAWQGDELVGRGVFSIWSPNDNRHLADFWVGVRPDMRRQGIARRLLAPIVAAAEQEQRRLLVTWTNDRVPASDSFLNRLGAHMGLESHTNQLRIADVDLDQLRAWQERARQRAPEFQLGFWEGAHPEELIPAMIEARKGMNLAPMGSIEWEDHITTPEELREQDASRARRGIVRWTMYVREGDSGPIAGYTEVFWDPQYPERLWQEETTVLPPYRNRGLGRLVKAAMLEKVIRERPQVQYVRTGNADSNAPMLKINYDLGYKPYMAERVWQVETTQARAYLGPDAE